MTLSPPSRRVKPASTARPSHLFLAIGETFYTVRPVGPDPDAALKAFRLLKADGTLYDVAQTPFGPACDCPDFIYRRDGTDPAGCKHVQALVAYGLIAGLPESPG